MRPRFVFDERPRACFLLQSLKTSHSAPYKTEASFAVALKKEELAFLCGLSFFFFLQALLLSFFRAYFCVLPKQARRLKNVHGFCLEFQNKNERVVFVAHDALLSVVRYALLYMPAHVP